MINKTKRALCLKKIEKKKDYFLSESKVKIKKKGKVIGFHDRFSF